MSWEKVKLTSLCRPRQWKTLSMNKLQPEGFPVYGANGKIGFYSTYTHQNPTLAIACRGTCGNVHITDPMSYINGNAMALDNLSNKIDIKFLFYYLQFRGFKDVISGSSQPQITGEGLSKVEVLLPPLETQKRIVDILDSADALRQKDLELLKKYDELAQAIFIDMFGDPVKNDKGWDEVKLESVCLKITDGTHQSPKFLDKGIPFLLVSNIEKNKINYNTKKFISEEDYEILNRRTPVEIGNILLTTVGSYGNPAIILNQSPFAFQRHIAFLKPNHKIINYTYLFGILLSPLVKNQIDKLVNGVAQKTLNLYDLKKLKIWVPPVELQEKYSKKMNRLESSLSKMDSGISTVLFNSLLQKAFNGELVA